ncbi:hypothetical protein ACQ4M3_38955 [Leptolyngbya sp. AN03gr2]|uniref:hypothetical protein n=1 Tax=unclassified Leptolyngbya TaxID=2650499 RepID=UPI003D322CBF
MQLNSEQQAWAIRVVRDCCGIETSDDQLMALLSLYPYLLDDIIVDTDTVAREHLMGAIAQRLRFSGWVSYGDSENDSRASSQLFPNVLLSMDIV